MIQALRRPPCPAQKSGAGYAKSGQAHAREFVRCAGCGCVFCWRKVAPRAESYVGVNMRMFEPEQLGPVRIRRLDGARSWKYLD